jgi:hypothetical protein
MMDTCSLKPGPMSNDNNQDRERNVRDRIATFVQAQARRKRAKEEEARAPRVAAARLDQLLTDIARKETAPELKLRHLRKK